MGRGEIHSAWDFHQKVRSCVERLPACEQRIDWIILCLGVVLLTLFVACTYLTLSGQVSPLVGAAANLVLIYACQIVTHEAAHQNVVDVKALGAWPNTVIGYLSSIPLLWDFNSFRMAHRAHHLHTNDEHVDPHFPGNITQSWRNVHRMARGVFARCFLRSGNTPDAPDKLKNSTSHYKFAQPTSWYVFYGLAVVSFAVLPKVLLVVWVLPAIIASAVIVRMHQVLHTEAEGSKPGIAKSKLILGSGPLGTVINIVFLYQNCHLLHHMMPRLPFHRLAALSKMLIADLSIRGFVNLDFSSFPDGPHGPR